MVKAMEKASTNSAVMPNETETDLDKLISKEMPEIQSVADAFHPQTAINHDEVERAKAEIDLNDTNTITRFGFSASQNATSTSQEMVKGVRNKDTGPVGEVMSDMLLKIRSLDAKDLQGGGFFGFLKSQASRIASFGQKFETVQAQIETMKSNLLEQQVTLMTSVASMDRLYETTEEQFHNLEVYIVAGQQVLDDLNNNQIPKMKKEVELGNDGSDGTPASLMPQKFADLQARRDQLERKIHDLKLVRMVALQALPKIRLTQESDNNLISKIDSIVTTTIPIWYQEMAINIEVAKTKKAADLTNQVTDATNEMLERGAEAFKQATLDARKSVERGVVGIDAIKFQNDKLIETLEEAINITKAGKAAREEADKVLVTTERTLREALKQTS